MKHQVGRSAQVLMIRILGAALQLVLVAVVAAFYSLDAVGFNGMLWSAVAIARTAGAFGVDVLSLRAMADFHDRGLNHSVYGQSRLAYRYVLVAWVLIIAALLLILAIASIPANVSLFCLGLAFVAFLTAISKICTVTLISTNRIISSQVIESILLPLLGIFAALFTVSFGSEGLILGQIVVFILGCAVYLCASQRHSSKSTPSHTEIQSISFRECAAVSVGTILTALSTRSPIFFIGAASPAAAGIFEVAQRIQNAGAMGVSAVSTVALPDIARTSRRGFTPGTWKFFVKLSLTAMSLPSIVLVAMPLIDLVIRTYTDLPAAEISVTASLLLAAILVQALTVSFFSLLNYAGMSRFAAVVAAIQLGFMLTALWLVPNVEPTTVALIIVGSEAIRSTLLTLLVRRWSRRQRG